MTSSHTKPSLMESITESTVEKLDRMDRFTLSLENLLAYPKVTDLDEGLLLIECTFCTIRTSDLCGSIGRSFKLEHFSSCCQDFRVSWKSYQPVPPAHKRNNCEVNTPLMIELSLKRNKLSGCGRCKDDYVKLAAVWAHVDTCQKIILEPFRPGIWKSAEFPFIVSDLKSTIVSIPYKLWIKFSRSVGEMNIHRQIANLYINQLNCDVTFCFDAIETDEQIGGHMTILSARSAVFAAMFQNGMKETATKKVSIKGIKPDIFKQLLYYIYSGRTSRKLSEEIAQPLFTAADVYDISDLKNECVRFLLSCIKLENAVNLMAWAYVHSISTLKEAALDFVASHGKEICQQDDWERLMKNYPDLCLLATRSMWQ